MCVCVCWFISPHRDSCTSQDDFKAEHREKEFKAKENYFQMQWSCERPNLYSSPLSSSHVCRLQLLEYGALQRVCLLYIQATFRGYLCATCSPSVRPKQNQETSFNAQHLPQILDSVLCHFQRFLSFLAEIVLEVATPRETNSASGCLCCLSSHLQSII